MIALYNGEPYNYQDETICHIKEAIFSFLCYKTKVINQLMEICPIRIEVNTRYGNIVMKMIILCRVLLLLYFLVFWRRNERKQNMPLLHNI